MLTSLQKHLPAEVPVTRRACCGVLDAESVLHSHAYMTALVNGGLSRLIRRTTSKPASRPAAMVASRCASEK